MADVDLHSDLIVRPESIERAYERYRSGLFLVNRRYQRKLIWTLDEKRRFIDSIYSGFPIPLILLAGDKTKMDDSLEIIDGMQRLNAIMSFIENEFTVDEKYFDLNSMAVTKQLLDSGELVQHTPVASREYCVRIAKYGLPLSIYQFRSGGHVDEVFRRINSGGRQLSRQELRAAGATGEFAQLVRRIASKTRGDDSARDVLELSGMKKISITNAGLSYGIPVEEIFWVAQGVLTKEQVRESRDEELIADILSQMVSDAALPSRSEFIDDYFNRGTEEAARRRHDEIDAAIRRRGSDFVLKDFQRVFDLLRLLVEASTFAHLLFPSRPIGRAPRYFQVVFLALYQLLIKDGKDPINIESLRAKLRNSGRRISVGGGGGKWGAEQRQEAVDAVVGKLRRQFAPRQGRDPAEEHWVSQLENLLAQSLTEQSLYDFKQGFVRLNPPISFDDDSFAQVMRTCVAIANVDREAIGYVLVGVSDKRSTADRVATLFKTAYKAHGAFFVTGVGHEASSLGCTEEQYFSQVVEKIKASKVSVDLKASLAQKLKFVHYYDKICFVFEVRAQQNVSLYDGRILVRQGPSVNEIAAEEVPSFIQRYLAGR